MTTTKKILLGCSIAAAIAGFGLLLVVGGCIFFFSSGPKGVTIQIENPSSAKAGETIELLVRVTNDRASQPFKLSDIDLDDDYLKAFVVAGTEPEYKSSSHSLGSQSFTFDVSIPAKQTREFKFKLRAVTAGVYKGDVDVYEGLRSITKIAETEIK
jgi:hypothetical protein